MRLTAASVHAVRALVHLANENKNRVVASHVIAAAEGMPRLFLLKVLKPLVSARLLHSIKGPHGGYRLTRPADRITLLDVIEAVEGPLPRMVPDVSGKETAKLHGRLQQVCDRAAELVRRRLRRVSVQDLAGQKG